MQQAMTHKMYEIARLIYGLMKTKKRNYHIIDRDWMLETLEKRHRCKMSAGALDKSLKRLRDMGILKSRTRHIRDKDGTFLPRASLYYMTQRLTSMFSSLTRGLAQLAGVRFLADMQRKMKRAAQEVADAAKRTATDSPQQAMETPPDPARPPLAAAKDSTDQQLTAQERNEANLLENMRKANERAKPRTEKSREFHDYLQGLRNKHCPE